MTCSSHSSWKATSGCWSQTQALPMAPNYLPGYYHVSPLLKISAAPMSNRIKANLFSTNLGASPVAMLRPAHHGPVCPPLGLFYFLAWVVLLHIPTSPLLKSLMHLLQEAFSSASRTFLCFLGIVSHSRPRRGPCRQGLSLTTFGLSGCNPLMVCTQ